MGTVCLYIVTSQHWALNTLICLLWWHPSYLLSLFFSPCCLCSLHCSSHRLCAVSVSKIYYEWGFIVSSSPCCLTGLESDSHREEVSNTSVLWRDWWVELHRGLLLVYKVSHSANNDDLKCTRKLTLDHIQTTSLYCAVYSEVKIFNLLLQTACYRRCLGEGIYFICRLVVYFEGPVTLGNSTHLFMHHHERGGAGNIFRPDLTEPA